MTRDEQLLSCLGPGFPDPAIQIDEIVLDQINAVDDDLEDAMQTRDQERFSRLLALVGDAASGWTPIISPPLGAHPPAR